jgi:ATP-dependent exoDNAse (exonuclease V) beta subunit
MSLDYLSTLHPHPRDARIRFIEEGHKYFVDDEEGYTSVTTWNHDLFPHFDAESIVARILQSSRWKNDSSYAYYQKTKEEILAGWDKNRDQAAASGTRMHLNIEKYYNGVAVEDESAEYSYFLKFRSDHMFLEAFRTEWMIFDEETRISGSVDMVFRDVNTGAFHIYDWKRSKGIEWESPYGKTAVLDFLSHVPDTNFWHYSLQLNTYRYILEKLYGMVITDLFLVVFHPSNASYEKVRCADMREELDAIMAYRKKNMLLLKPSI